MTTAGPFECEDELVRLRPFRPLDVADVTAACQDAEIARWTAAIPSPYTLTRWAFDRPGIDRLELLTKVGNVRSERVASNAGFELADEIGDHRPANARDDRLHHVKRWVLFPHRCHP